MQHKRQPPTVPIGRSPEEQAYQNSTSSHSVDYRIRSESNHLYEDPDIDEDIVYRIIPGNLVTDEYLDICANNFSSDYGVWSWRAHLVMGTSAEYGKPIHTNRVKLRAQCLSKGANNFLVIVVTKDGRHVGHCFMSQWMHGDDRVWWVTQLLVLKGYCNQRRATRMLQALAVHCDIGRSTQRDLVGIVTPNPYSVCAILRVFGRGIEVLPSKPDWEKHRVRHTPLPSSACEPIISSSPVNYVREAKLSSGKLVSNTRFFVDHAVAEEALKRIIHSMNQQVVGPWEWLFGCLEPGYEYVCILDYSYDREYNMDPAILDTSSILNVSQPEKHFSSPPKALFRTALGSPKPLAPTSSPIQYGELDRYMLEVPESCILDPALSNRAHASLHGSMRKLIYEAKEVIAKHMHVLPVIMGAKQIPNDLQRAYQSSNMNFPLPGCMQTWNEFIPYAHDVFAHNINVEARMSILQAIHFQELRGIHEREQRQDTKKALKLAKATGSKEKKRSVKAQKGEPLTRPCVLTEDSPQSNTEEPPAKSQTKRRFTSITPTRRPLAPKPHALHGAVKATAKTPTPTPRPRATSMFSSLSPFRRNKVPKPQIQSSSTARKIPSPTPPTLEQTPPQHCFDPTTQTTASTLDSVASNDATFTEFVHQSQNQLHGDSTSIPPTTPSSSQPQPSLPHYMAPTIGSMQRYETHSPSLFYSDESDGCSRSNLFGRFSLKNGAKTLDRTQGMRG